jgi:nucleoside-diphosphate-sugar epimerase
MKLIIFGNKGSFLDSVIKTLSNSSDVDSYSIDKSDALFASRAIDHISNLDFSCYDAVVYISGETRDELYMHFLNFRLPSILLERISGLQTHFIYLSSLAVFAGNKSDKITVNSPFLPLDNYGETKVLFERFREFFANNHSLPKVSAIYPASFLSGSGSSSVEKFQSIRSRYVFLQIFKLNGALSFIHRDSLAHEIQDILTINLPKKVILAENYMLANLGGIINIPRLPIFIFKAIDMLSQKTSLKLRMVLRGILYV